MDWKQSLDRYLTTPPDGGFDEYCEQIDNNFTPEFFEAHEDWIMDSTQYLDWADKCLRKDLSPPEAAKIIERAFNIWLSEKN